MKQLLIVISALLLIAPFHAGGNCTHPEGTTTKETAWADSVFRSLSREQRIAQLLMIRAFSDRDSAYDDSLTSVISRWNVGGVCFFKGTPFRQAMLTNRWQKTVQTPLLIATDAEWGLGMRLDSAFAFPKPMTLGAVADDSLVYRVGRAIGKDCKRLGVQVNFAPVLDINSNPSNPVIGFRSFGEDKYDVALKGLLYMKGLQDEGIFATGKHFPGHGNTDSDSHLTLPVIRGSGEELDSTELFPFRELIRNGLQGVMTGHLFVPSYDSAMNMAATLSSRIVDSLLKKKLGFKGWAITDALDMKGVTNFFKPGEIEVRALEAGNDILLLPQDVPVALSGILHACDSSDVLQNIADEKCRKVLLLKHRLGLGKLLPVRTEELYNDLNPQSSSLLSEEVYRSAVTLVRNSDRIIPLNFLDRRKIAALSIGDTQTTVFQKVLGRYATVRAFNLPSNFSKTSMDSVIRLLAGNDLVIIGIHCYSSYPVKRYGFPELASNLIDSLSQSCKIILTILGSPYTLSFLKNPGKIEAILVSYLNTPAAEAASAELIFGGIPATGRLPVSGSPDFAVHSGEHTNAVRLDFIRPELIGIPSKKLKIIDSLARLGIEKRAYPGCQIVLVRDGKVFYEKSFGHPRYGDTIPVNNSDIYDIASLTKVAATTLAIMRLYEQGKISLDGKLGTYLDEAKGSDKENLVIRDILTHQAGLQPWIPFYEKTLKDGVPDPAVYRNELSPQFPFRVANDLYIRQNYPDQIIRQILRSPLSGIKEYKYSDLGFYLLARVIENITGKKLDEYLDAEFYRPLGLTTLGFHPRERFEVSRIMPTEYDTLFRKQPIRGDVHDPGAAMMGGVSGHAGLFSNATDLAVILQIFLNGGNYGGKQYFLPSTIRMFTFAQFPESGNRRALGFDKPLKVYSPDGPACRSASPQSFGHSGFTGTYFWVDPSNNLIYVFLSNRVYPDAGNRRLAEMNLRTQIHQAVYDLLGQ